MDFKFIASEFIDTAKWLKQAEPRYFWFVAAYFVLAISYMIFLPIYLLIVFCIYGIWSWI